MQNKHGVQSPSLLLKKYAHLLLESCLDAPVLDLACGRGRNGVFLANKGLDMVLCDRSVKALEQAGLLARQTQVAVDLWQVDLEIEGDNPLAENTYKGIVVFNYLHRPLIECIKKAIKPDGFLIYETFTTDQLKFGRPSNPHFLLKPGELAGWFDKWHVIHSFEGELDDPLRAVAQLVCQKRITASGWA